MTARRWLTFVEIDISYGTCTYGVSPCVARIGTTGTQKCFNTLGSCQDRAHYAESFVTLRFVKDAGYQAESDIEAIPSLLDADLTPSEVSLGEGLGRRASVTCSFRGHPHADTGQGFDKYRASRGYNPYEQGWFWAKFAARHPNLRGKKLRVIQGYLGQALEEMEARHYIIDSVDGPSLDGKFSIVAKDPLKALDGERAQAPKISTGFFAADVTETATTATLAPAGAGNAGYPAAGWVSCGSEVIAFTRAGDALTLTRGQRGTTADAHKAGDRVQLCLAYTAQSPADIIANLETVYAPIDPAYIPLADWRAEVAAYNGQVYTAFISEPTSVKTLVAELIEQAGLATWWDEVGEKQRLQVLRQIATDVQRFDETMIRQGSLRITAQPDKRFSQIWAYFAQRNPIEGDDLKNFPGVVALVNADAEANYGSPAVKTIVSRWIPTGGRLIAERLTEIQLGRYLMPPRKVEFDLIESDGLALPVQGGGYRISAPMLQGVDGARVEIAIQVTSIRRKNGVCSVTAEELNWVDLKASDPLNRIITIDYASYNLSLRTLHDNLYGAPVPGGTVTLILSSSARIGSTAAAQSALQTGVWPTSAFTATRTNGGATLTAISNTSAFVVGQAVTGTGIQNGARVVSKTANSVTLDKAASASGTSSLTLHLVILNLVINGQIIGKGGNGGNGKGGDNNTGGRGADGGLGLKVEVPVNITGTGKIDGGGGGGGGGGGDYQGWFGPQVNGGGGGGGAGDVAGDGGAAGASNARAGSPGTPSAGGKSGSSSNGWHGGKGGDPGQDGSNATGDFAGTRGVAGASVNGVALIRDDAFTGAYRGAKT
jgi:hypothetical protein